MAKKPENIIDTSTLVLDVDDSQLRRKLQSAERVAQESAQRMQQTTARMQQKVGAGVSALGQAAAVSTNQFAGMAAQVAAMAVTMGPLALAIGVIIVAWRLFSSAQERAKSKADALNQTLATQKERIDALKGQLSGTTASSRLRAEAEGLRNQAFTLQSDVDASARGPNLSAFVEDPRTAEAVGLLKQSVNLRAEADAIDKIANNKRKEAIINAEIDRQNANRLRVEQQIADIVAIDLRNRQEKSKLIQADLDAQRNAQQAQGLLRLKGGLPATNAAEADSQIFQALSRSDAQLKAQALIVSKLIALVTAGELSQLDAARAAGGLGISFSGVEASASGRTIGSVAAESFRNAGSGTGVLTSAEQKGEQRDEKRNTTLVEMRDFLRDIEQRSSAGMAA